MQRDACVRGCAHHKARGREKERHGRLNNSLVDERRFALWRGGTLADRWTKERANELSARTRSAERKNVGWQMKRVEEIRTLHCTKVYFIYLFRTIFKSSEPLKQIFISQLATA